MPRLEAAVKTTRPSRCASCKWRPRRSMVLSSRAKAPRYQQAGWLWDVTILANWVHLIESSQWQKYICLYKMAEHIILTWLNYKLGTVSCKLALFDQICAASISCLCSALGRMPGVLHFLRNDFNGFLDVAKPIRISGSPFMVRRSSSLVEGGPDLWNQTLKENPIRLFGMSSDWRI